MAVVVSDNKGYTQDEFKEYLKTTIASISSDVATNASNASTSETNASNYAKQAKDSASAASGAEDSAHQYSSSALQSATNASASETNAKTSETNATTSATNAEASNQSAKKWAEATDSPDGANDTDSSTGKTQSAKSWALAAKASEANAKTSETNAANSARTLQADWNATDTTLQSYIKNKPDALTSIGNDNTFRIKSFAKSDNGGRATYRVIQELTKYNPESAPDGYGTYGFTGILFKKTRMGNDSYLFPSIMNASLGYSLDGIFSTSEDEYPAVIHNTTTNKYYLAIRCAGSYCDVALVVFFTGPYAELGGEILENADGTLESGWEKVYDTPKFMEMRKIYAGKALMDSSGRVIVNTYATSAGISNAVTTNNLNSTNLTVTGQTSVPTANQGNSSNAIASTEFVAKSISALVNGAPEQLNTLNELATALGNDSNFSATITAELSKKANAVEVESTYAKKTDINNTYIISATEPKSPKDGCLWFDTTNMLIKLRADNAWKSFGAVYLS